MEIKRIYIKHIQILQINLGLKVTDKQQLARYKETALNELLSSLIAKVN
jgi:hypothetical protein